MASIKTIAIITTHPIQYQVPLFKQLNKVKNLKSYIFYGCNQGVKKKKIDKEFNRAFSWDISMLSGYKYFFAKKNSNYDSWLLRFPNLSSRLNHIKCDYLLILGWNKLIFLQAIFYAICNRIPILLRAENNLYGNKSFILRLVKKIIFKYFFSIFYKIIFIGKLNKLFYLHYGVEKNKLIFAPYFVDNNFFKSNKNKKKNKKNFFFNVLFVGKFIARKRPFDILKAAEILKEYKNINFTLVGDGPLLKDCKNFAKSKSISNLNFLGFQNQSQIKKIYNNSEILVNASNFETWGLVINEAMSAGLPCIVTNKTGCASDLIIKGETGYVYPVGNIVALQKYILKIYNNKKLYLKMSSNVNNIIKKYNIKNTVNAISKSIYL